MMRDVDLRKELRALLEREAESLRDSYTHRKGPHEGLVADPEVRRDLDIIDRALSALTPQVGLDRERVARVIANHHMPTDRQYAKADAIIAMLGGPNSDGPSSASLPERPLAERLGSTPLEILASHVPFFREAARYFSSRPTRGEDMAHWSNVANAGNCTKIADAIEQLLEPGSAAYGLSRLAGAAKPDAQPLGSNETRLHLDRGAWREGAGAAAAMARVLTGRLARGDGIDALDIESAFILVSIKPQITDDDRAWALQVAREYCSEPPPADTAADLSPLERHSPETPDDQNPLPQPVTGEER